MTEEDILNKLREVIDPELEINLVDLGLVYEVKENKGNVTVVMTLTTPGCPLMGMFEEEIKKRIKQIKGVKKIKVELTFDPPWTPEKMSKEAKKKLNWMAR